MNSENEPPRLGRLRHGNPSGNPHEASRCGARNRAGLPCRAPAMANGRCRSHGGKSTGPRTTAGRERLRAAHTVHGWHGAEGRALRAAIADLRAMGECLCRIVAARRSGQVAHPTEAGWQDP
jgi:hypothetical protein